LPAQNRIMLKQINIQNYALIDELTVKFNSGFSTLTGETGAGKSILLGALSLVLGNRADSNVINDEEKKCIVEAIFDITVYHLQQLFTRLDVDYQDETIIRRELSANGKSRAFINDTPVNLNDLKEIGLCLVDIHSQHESLELNNNQFQLKVLDAAAKNSEILKKYSQVYFAYKQTQSFLEQLEQQAHEASSDYDYNLFQFNQLSELKLEKINQEQLESEYQLLTNIGEIQQNGGTVLRLLEENEPNAIQQLKQAKQILEQTGRYFHKAVEFASRIEPMIIELKDLASELNREVEHLDYQPERITELKIQLDNLYNLMQKNQVNTVAELIEAKNSFGKKLNQSNDLGTEIEKTRKILLQLESELQSLAQQLTNQRNKTIEPLSKQIERHLTGLGMPNAQLRIQINSNSHYGPSGVDVVNFLFTANKNQELQNISKIASGGEISRLMLSIKSVLSESTALPTIIFDEIDTGVSGEIAHKMANLMDHMSQKMQVITITHLPQIAAKGKVQYRVYKKDSGIGVNTFVNQLTPNERIEEIARMLSGKDITKEAVENAKALLAQN
jgi:DNA repair protein RecN (Recombination protein N)